MRISIFVPGILTVLGVIFVIVSFAVITPWLSVLWFVAFFLLLHCERFWEAIFTTEFITTANGVELRGRRKRLYPGGSLVVENWKDDRFHGKYERFNPDGSYYISHWKNGKLHGKREWIYPDGSWFVENWKDDKLHGKYEQVNSDGSWEVRTYDHGTLVSRETSED